MVSIDPCKPLNRKRKPTASKLDASNKELVAKKVDNRFLFDVTTQEIEKALWKGSAQVTLQRVMNGQCEISRLGAMQEASNFLKICVQTNCFMIKT